MKYFKNTEGQLYVDPIVENHEGLIEIDIYEFLLILKGDKDYSITTYEDKFMVYDGTAYLTVTECCPYQKASVQDNGDGTGTWVEIEVPPTDDELKLQGVEFQGVMCSATSRDMWGLKAVEELPKAGIPVNFHFDNGNSLVLTVDNWEAFQAVWVPFRQSFYPIG